jgi:hypothetical protein
LGTITMNHYPTFEGASSPSVRPFRREGRAWRYEFPYQPSSSLPDSQPRYSISLPEIGITLDGHGWLFDQPYRT